MCIIVSEPHSVDQSEDALLDDPRRPAPDRTAFRRRRLISSLLVGGALAVAPLVLITQALPGPLSIQAALWTQYALWAVAAIGALIISRAVTQFGDAIMSGSD